MKLYANGSDETERQIDGCNDEAKNRYPLACWVSAAQVVYIEKFE